MTTVLFATEYDTPNIIVNILSNTPTEHYLFPLIVKYRPSNLIEFVLQTQKCQDSVRIRPVFVCDARRLALSQYISSDTPLPANAICGSLDLPSTRAIYEHLFDNKEEKNEDLKCLVHFNKNSVLRYLNTVFLSPTSPSWFLSTYGTNEGTLLLTMSYYLFEKQYSTIQTTRDYTKCFTQDPGRPLFTYINMRDFMIVMNKSPFRKRVEKFSNYAKSRNARDTRELQFVDTKINNFREESRLPADSCVYYVYLAYKTALNREKFIKYCDYVEYSDTIEDSQQCMREENFLGRSLDDELISVMDTYFSVDGYFGSYIQIERVPLATPNTYRGYAWNTSAPVTLGYFSNMVNIANSIKRLNTTCDTLFSPLPPTIGGFLKLCSSDRHLVEQQTSAPVSRRNYLLNDKKTKIGPMPVFRIEMPDKRHVFCGIHSEDWNKRLLPKDFIKNIPTEYISDEVTTNSIWFHEDIAAFHEIGEQLYRTRHEIFNEHLPVFNFIGDVDLKLREDIREISKHDFFELCRALRNTLIEAWSHIFPNIDKDSHPIFFFKSACSTATTLADDQEFDIEPKFCSCKKKLGLRIIIPFPSGTVIFGGTALKRLAKILDHTLSLDRNLVQKLNMISHPGECFDTGIYHHGRSIRMPLMYKLDDDGSILHSRLNPIFIVPKQYQRNPFDFILQQLRPENLTHHGNSTNIEIKEVIVHISDKGCNDTESNFLQTRANRVSNRQKPLLGPLIRTHLNVDTQTEFESETEETDTCMVSDDNDLCEDDIRDIQIFARKIAWPQILEHTRNHYREEIQEQLESATVFTTVGRNSVAVKRASCGRIKDFRCLVRDHRIPQETVQVFMDIRGDYRHNVWVTLWSRCFTRKCNSNAKQTHISIKIPAPSQY